MSRPFYEDSGDRANESAAMRQACSVWGLDFHKLPISYRLDYALTSNDVIKGFAEVKCRRFEWDTYPDVMVSVSKVQAAKSLYAATNQGSIFLVRANERLFWTSLHETGDSRIVFGGRTTQTRDSADVEPVVHIPCKNFREIVAP